VGCAWNSLFSGFSVELCIVFSRSALFRNLEVGRKNTASNKSFVHGILIKLNWILWATVSPQNYIYVRISVNQFVMRTWRAEVLQPQDSLVAFAMSCLWQWSGFYLNLTWGCCVSDAVGIRESASRPVWPDGLVGCCMMWWLRAPVRPTSQTTLRTHVPAASGDALHLFTVWLLLLRPMPPPTHASHSLQHGRVDFTCKFLRKGVWVCYCL